MEHEYLLIKLSSSKAKRIFFLLLADAQTRVLQMKIIQYLSIFVRILLVAIEPHNGTINVQEMLVLYLVMVDRIITIRFESSKIDKKKIKSKEGNI